MTERARHAPEGEEQETPAPHPEAGFGDAAGEMANETEVEVSPEEDELTVTKIALAERTADLQRLQAEFVNYKRRVDRDRELIRENATYTALAPITEVLDTIDRAREHAPLEGGFKAVADQLERVVAARRAHQVRGRRATPSTPTIHEALSHIGEDPEVEVTTCKVVAKAGYRIGDRVVRAAQVLVVDPPSGPTAEYSDTTRDEEGGARMSTTDGMRADWAQKDFYAELGVKKDATADEIKKAYRKLARANHPDSNPGDTAKHDKFKSVAEAYDVVGDADKRKKYDEMRVDYASGGFGFPGGRRRSGWCRLRHQRPAARPGGRGGGGFGDMFGDLFGRQSAPGGVARRRAPTSRPRRRSASPTPSRASRCRCG